jgi:hypothetical protein
METDKQRRETPIEYSLSSLYRASRHTLGRSKRASLKLLSVFSMISRIGKILLQRLFHRSDYQRWANPENLEAWWESRTQKISQLVPPNSRVIEFGAGRCLLKRYLDSSCTYFPSDLVDRGPGTIICDLNKRPLPDVKAALNSDVAVFAGVLEYVRDLPAVIEWLSNQVSFCVVSYTCVESEPNSIQRFPEMFDRSYYGYLNEYREKEFVALFERYGFLCIKKDRWTSQLLFLFVLSTQRSAVTV